MTTETLTDAQFHAKSLLPCRPHCDPDVGPMEEPTSVEIMKHAKKLVENGWCKKAAAKCKRGAGIIYLDEQAVSFCVAGAIGRSVDDLMACHSGERRDRRNIDCAVNFMSANDIKDIPKWNDKWYRTKRSVMRAFDRAIEECHMEDRLKNV
jgi:hypothetical protein